MPQKPLHIIISGGGTGGHIYPAIAIADALREADPQTRLLFVGAQGRMEMEKVPQAGYDIEGLWISGIQRGQIMKNLLVPFKVIASLMKAGNIIRRFRPDAVVGVGGYASWALVQSARWKGIPALLQEQNGYAGLTNRLLKDQVQTICVAYPGMEQYFPAAKLVQTGNPVRKDIIAPERYRAEALAHFGLTAEKPILFVFGGSLGARTLNEAVKAALPGLLDTCQLIWQTGKTHYDSFKALGNEYAGRGLVVLPFLKEMHLAYAAANVVVGRAGALSISELAVAGKPAILVPSPNVTDDHQTKNALALVQQQAAILVKDADAAAQLIFTAQTLLADTNAQAALATNIRAFGQADAAQRIAAEVRKLAHRKTPAAA